MTAMPDVLVEDGKPTNDLESAKFTKDKDTVDVVQPTAKLIGLTKEQLEQYRNDPFWKAIRYTLFVAFWLIWLAMFVGAILIVVLSPKCPEVKWTQNMVNYKIFTLAFGDSISNDGLGDFAGIKEKLSDLKDLGVNTIWPTPVLTFNKNELSPEAIVTLDVAEQLGGVEGFREMVKQAHAKDMKVVVDLPLTVDTKVDNWAKNFTSGSKDGIALVNLDDVEISLQLLSLAIRFLEYGVDGFSITDYGILNNYRPDALITQIRALPGAEHLPIFSELPLKSVENYYLITPIVGDEQLDGLKEKLEGAVESAEKGIGEEPGERMWRLGSMDPNGHRLDKLLGNKARNMSNDQKQRVSAIVSAVQLFIPAPVSVLYGEELGLLSGNNPSPNKKLNRVAYPWTNETLGLSGKQTFFAVPENARDGNFETQKTQPNSPLNLFKTIAKLRQHPDFLFGKLDHSSHGDISIYFVKRFPSNDGFYVLVINWSGEEKLLSIDDLPEALKEKQLENVVVRASTEPNVTGKVNLAKGAEPIKFGPFGALLLDIPS